MLYMTELFIENCTESIINDSFAVIVETQNHATAFYICDGESYYYDDGHGKIKFNWKKILKICLTHKDTHIFILYWYEGGGLLPILKDTSGKKCLVLDYEGNKIAETLITEYKNCAKYIVQDLIFIKKE